VIFGQLPPLREIDSDDDAVGPHVAVADPTHLLPQRQATVHVGDAGDFDQRDDVPLPAIALMQSPVGLFRLDAGQKRRSAGGGARIASRAASVIACREFDLGTRRQALGLRPDLGPEND